MKIFVAIFAILAHFFVFGKDILVREETREEKVLSPSCFGFETIPKDSFKSA